MTAAAYCPTSTVDFEPSGLLTTLQGLFPTRRRPLANSDATLSNARRQFSFASPSGDELIVTLSRDFEPPAWFSDVMERLARLIGLNSDWDSYGARPVELESVVATLEFLLVTMGPTTPIPELVPTPRGTIQLEWHIHGIDCEIDALSRGLYRMAFEDFRSNHTIEDLVTSNLDDFRQPLSLLAAN